MARRSFRRNYIAAGLFLIAALALSVWMSVLLSDLLVRLEDTTGYEVVFSLEEGTAGLDRGSPVTLGGQRIGRVTGVTPRLETNSAGIEVVTGQVAHMEIEPGLTLYENAKVTLILPMFGTVSSLNIRDVGAPVADVLVDDGTFERRSFAMVPAGGELNGDLAPGLLIQAGFRPEDVYKFREAIDNVVVVTRDAKKITQDLTPLVTGDGNRIASILENADETTALLLTRTDEISAEAQALVVDARSVVEQVGPAVERADRAIAGLEAGVEEWQAGLINIREMIEEQRPAIERIVQNVEATTESIRLESVERLNELLETGQVAAQQYADVAEQAQSLMVRSRPEIDRVLSNARIASDNLALTVEEIRAQPWRLLRRPKTRELEQQLLYDSARAYARAVSDLRAVSESLEATLAEAPVGQEAEALQRLRDQLERQFQEYRVAEQALLERISEGG